MDWNGVKQTVKLTGVERNELEVMTWNEVESSRMEWFRVGWSGIE